MNFDWSKLSIQAERAFKFWARISRETWHFAFTPILFLTNVAGQMHDPGPREIKVADVVEHSASPSHGSDRRVDKTSIERNERSYLMNEIFEFNWEPRVSVMKKHFRPEPYGKRPRNFANVVKNFIVMIWCIDTYKSCVLNNIFVGLGKRFHG